MATIIDRDSGGGAVAVVIALLAALLIAAIAFGVFPVPGSKAPDSKIEINTPSAPTPPATQ